MASTLAGFHQACRAVYGSPSPQWIKPPPVPQALLDQFYTTEENPMAQSFDPNSYGKADQIGPLPLPTPDAVAKAHRKQAARIEAQVKAQKKAAKKAKRAERQRQDDINLAVDVMADIAGDIDARDEDRLAAAGGLLSHYTDY